MSHYVTRHKRPEEEEFVKEYGAEKGRHVFGAVLGKLHRQEEEERERG